MTLETLIRERRLIVCVGPGGVGKTTLAAALALAAARAGRRTAVITIDPARRLADALGLDGLDDELRPVADLPLQAAMLDTKESYDALIKRITDDPEAQQRILSNRVYRSFSRTLARSHAYVAMERLHDVLTAGEHDLVVLDTPPTRSALDILDAPARLVRFLDERILNAFVGDGKRGARAWIRAKGTEVAMKLFSSMAGDSLTAELAGFFGVFFHLRHGFAERAARVTDHFAANTTSFVMVTAPEETHLADAAYLRDGLLARGVPLDTVIFNRAFHAGPDGRPLRPTSDWQDDAVIGGEGVRHVCAAARRERVRLLDANARFAEGIERFTAAAPVGRSTRFVLPVLDAEPATLEALAGLLDQGR